jgi:tetratricopeptide (TPR) repeat protein
MFYDPLKMLRSALRLLVELYDEGVTCRKHLVRSGITWGHLRFLRQCFLFSLLSLRSAYREATMLYARALTLLPMWSTANEGTSHALALHLAMGQALMLHKGYAAPEVEHAYTKALRLCQADTPPSLHVQVLSGLASFWIARGKFDRAQELAGQGLALARQLGNASWQLHAQVLLGITSCYLGEPRYVCAALAPGIATYEAHRGGATLTAAEVELAVPCLSYTGLALWSLGYPEQAHRRSAEALALARQCGRPSVLALALFLACAIHQDRRDLASVQACVGELLTLTREYELPFWFTWGQTYRGWVLVEQGQVKEGIQHWHESLAVLQASGAEGGFSDTLMFLADAYGREGQPEQGLAVLQQALTGIAENGERYYEAEAYRLKGELLLNAERRMMSDERKTPQKERGISPIPRSSFLVHHSEEAEACFLKAIDIARQQHAKSLELRALMSLVRFRQCQAAQHVPRPTQHESQVTLAEAHKMLTDVYGWFTEGFDTKDLQEAKALLGELSD